MPFDWTCCCQGECATAIGVENMWRATLIVAMLLAASAWANPPDLSARRLLSGWKDPDLPTRLLVEVIASAFSNGLALRNSLGGKDVYCPPPGLNGHKIMSAFAHFLEENPDMAERPYGDAMAASLS